jgi:dihydropteroate synthase
MSLYYRPIPQIDRSRGKDSYPLAGGKVWFSKVEILERNRDSYIVPAPEIPDHAMHTLIDERSNILGFSASSPIIMGILNVTPDSFSDGNKWSCPAQALVRVKSMISDGVDIIDIGGESTRPGFKAISKKEELSRVIPIIKSIRDVNLNVPLSIDTTKAAVAAKALEVGVDFVNDVSAMLSDVNMADVVKINKAPVCLMHSDPIASDSSNLPLYENVLLDVYDFLAKRLQDADLLGIPRSKIVVDPGIGFGKTMEHNLILLNGLSLFHSLGCTLLLGASRKRFIGTISGESQPEKRMAGSIAVSIEGLRQGVQILRVHDIAENCQATRMWKAMNCD